MGSVQLNSSGLVASLCTHKTKLHYPNSSLLLSSKQNATRLYRAKTIRAISTAPASQPPAADEPDDEPPAVDFAFVHSVLLPDGTPDVHWRRACGGQKLRDIMLDTNIELYGPYNKPLSNCAGVGTCATCMVEVLSFQRAIPPTRPCNRSKRPLSIAVDKSGRDVSAISAPSLTDDLRSASAALRRIELRLRRGDYSPYDTRRTLTSDSDNTISDDNQE